MERESRRETQRAAFGKNVAIHATDRIRQNERTGHLTTWITIGSIAILLLILWFAASIFTRKTDAERFQQTKRMMKGLDLALPKVIALWDESENSKPAPLNTSGPRQDMIHYIFEKELAALREERVGRGAGTQSAEHEKKLRALERLIELNKWSDDWGKPLIVESVFIKAKVVGGKEITTCLLRLKSLGADGVDNTDAVIGYYKDLMEKYKKGELKRKPREINPEVGPDEQQNDDYLTSFLEKDPDFKAYDIVISHQVSTIPTPMQAKSLREDEHLPSSIRLPNAN